MATLKCEVRMQDGEHLGEQRQPGLVHRGLGGSCCLHTLSDGHVQPKQGKFPVSMFLFLSDGFGKACFGVTGFSSVLPFRRPHETSESEL